MAHRDTSDLKPRKTPKQRRSAELVDAVLEAATRIVESEGLDALTIPALCKRAGVSPGSLYQYFGSKDAVIYALLRQHAEAVTEAMSSVLATGFTASPSALIDAAVDAFIDAHRPAPRTHAALGAWVANKAGPGLEADLMQRLQVGLEAVLVSRQTEWRGSSPSTTAFLLIRTLESTVHAAVRDAPELLDEPDFGAQIKRMMSALLE